MFCDEGFQKQVEESEKKENYMDTSNLWKELVVKFPELKDSKELLKVMQLLGTSLGISSEPLKNPNPKVKKDRRDNILNLTKNLEKRFRELESGENIIFFISRKGDRIHHCYHKLSEQNEIVVYVLNKIYIESYKRLINRTFKIDKKKQKNKKTNKKP